MEEEEQSKHQKKEGYSAKDERQGTKRMDGAAEAHRGKEGTSGNEGRPESKQPQHEEDTDLYFKEVSSRL